MSSLSAQLALKSPEAVKQFIEFKITDEVQAQLETAEFDNWQFAEDQLPQLVEHIFERLGLLDAFDINRKKFRTWLVTLRAYYHPQNPFHNFQHAFCVTQMMYVLIRQLKLDRILSQLDILVLIFSAISHDIDHPALSNTYQINGHTILAVRTNDQSPLEQHHCAMAFALLKEPGCDIISPSDNCFKDFRSGVIALILATDLSKQHSILTRIKSEIIDENISIRQAVSAESVDKKLLLMQLLMKAADVSVEVRPYENSKRWVTMLYQEFISQNELEKRLKLPLTMPNVDHELTVVETARNQNEFINRVLLPVYETVEKLFGTDAHPLLSNIMRSLETYKSQIN